MANRLFNLPETKGTFQVKGKINRVESERFYTAKKTKTGKDFRAVNFGCEYDNKKTVFINLTGIPQMNVYFSKRNPETKKNETRPIPWANRHSFNEEGWRLIGNNLGLTKIDDGNGKMVNDKVTLTDFDSCEYIATNLKDDMSTFIRGNVDFSSYEDNQGNIRRSIKYVPSQVSLCQEVDFENNIPVNDFTQTIMFMEINKEEGTNRFVVSAKIVTWNDIVNTEFIITDAKLANLFKKNLKPYTAITVHGKIEVSHQVEEVVEDDGWGMPNTMTATAVSAPTVTEMVITGADPSSIDRDTYNEENVAEAMRAIRNSKTADRNFNGQPAAPTVTESTGWSMDDSFDDVPW